jgi:Tfp pilus assembly protein PilP
MKKESPADSRMIIYSADVQLDIVNYDEQYEKIVSKVNEMGGYVSDANTSYKYYDEANPENSLKYGYMTIRVPQEHFTGAVDFLKTIGVEKNQNIWSQDITAQYRDIADEVANLEIREAKLREIMDRAEDVEDVITVERELSRVRGEINNYMGTLKNWDRLVSLSTIRIELNEVETLEPRIKPIDKTLMQKARDGFVNSINQLKYLGESLFVGLVAFSPKLVIWVILFFIGYKIVRWLLRHFRK